MTKDQADDLKAEIKYCNLIHKKYLELLQNKCDHQIDDVSFLYVQAQDYICSICGKRE
jgi:hypothetical protein